MKIEHHTTVPMIQPAEFWLPVEPMTLAEFVTQMMAYNV